MLHSYFSSEEDIRFVVMNALSIRNLKVWDCRSEVGKSPDPIWMENIELGILTGDFPFLWNGRFYVGEVKFKFIKEFFFIRFYVKKK